MSEELERSSPGEEKNEIEVDLDPNRWLGSYLEERIALARVEELNRSRKEAGLPPINYSIIKKGESEWAIVNKNQDPNSWFPQEVAVREIDANTWMVEIGPLKYPIKYEREKGIFTTDFGAPLVRQPRSRPDLASGATLFEIVSAIRQEARDRIKDSKEQLKGTRPDSLKGGPVKGHIENK
jgi:hypothetical protein